MKFKYTSTMKLLPHLIMDEVLTLYMKDVAPLDLANKLVQYRNNWKRSYHMFNSAEFYRFKDSSEEIVDLMDSMSEVIHDELVFLRVAIENLLPKASFEDQTILSSMYISNTLTSVADISHKAIYGKNNPQLQAIIHNSHMLMNGYMNKIGYHDDINPNDSKDATIRVERIWDKLLAWSKEQDIKRGLLS